MSTSQEQFIDVINKLNKRIDLAEFRVNESEKNLKKREVEERNLRLNKRNLPILKEAIIFYKQSIKDITDYNNKKMNKTINAVESAIYTSSQIVPLGYDVIPNIVGKEFSLESKDHIPLELTEGGGCRASLSFFIRSVILQNTNFLQLMIMDEVLATLSTESSVLLSSILPALAKRMQIWLIEQKEEVFVNAKGTTFRFQKIDGETRVWKEDDSIEETS